MQSAKGIKLANPLFYPLAVLAGAVVLVASVRLVNLNPVIAVPLAVVVATGGAALQKTQASGLLNNPALEQELRSARQQAQDLAGRANSLRTEAARLLTDANQMELLATVEFACDQASELPSKIDELARRMQGADSLLEVSELQAQLREVEARRRSSSGVAAAQLAKLAEALRRNIGLAQQGEDARQAQVVSLSTLIYDSAGVLQAMQNQLRRANLADASQTSQLRSLSEELRQFQENVDLLVSH
jgi:chromosome segregation ATPase